MSSSQCMDGVCSVGATFLFVAGVITVIVGGVMYIYTPTVCPPNTVRRGSYVGKTYVSRCYDYQNQQVRPISLPQNNQTVEDGITNMIIGASLVAVAAAMLPFALYFAWRVERESRASFRRRASRRFRCCCRCGCDRRPPPPPQDPERESPVREPVREPTRPPPPPPITFAHEAKEVYESKMMLS